MSRLKKHIVVLFLMIYTSFNIVGSQLGLFAHHQYINQQTQQIVGNNICNEDNCCETKNCLQSCETKNFVSISKTSKKTEEHKNFYNPAHPIFVLLNDSKYLLTIYNSPKERIYLSIYRKPPEVGIFVGITKLSI